MNGSQNIKNQTRRAVLGMAAVALSGVTIAVPSAAVADQNTDTGGSSTALTSGPTSYAIDDVVTWRKQRMAQDRVDRAWLYR